MPDTQKCFVFMPYLNMGDCPEVDFGFLKLSNFDLQKDVQVKDVALKTRIVKILEAYQRNNHPIKRFGVLYFGSGRINSLSPDKFKEFDTAKLILFISYLAEHNTVFKNGNTMHAMATADNFGIVFQNTDLSSDYTAEHSGVILPHAVSGFKIGEVRYSIPTQIPSMSGRLSIHKELFESLLALRTKKPRVFEKVINAVGVFFESYYNVESLSKNARVLLQMSAFEILLELDPTNISERNDFKDKIEKYTTTSEDKKISYFFETKGGKKRRDRRTLKGIWADRFYTLRNHIIHGLTPPPDDFIFQNRQSNTDIALLFLIVCMEKIIQSSLKISFKHEHEIQWKKWHDENFIQDREEFTCEISFRRLWNKMLKSRLKIKNRKVSNKA